MPADRPWAFVERRACPACQSPQTETVFANAFRDGAVGDFIRVYYKIEPEIFGDAEYRLARCQRCALLFQVYVGDDALLKQLYGDWINDSNHPDDDREYQAITAHPAHHRDAHEILSAAAYLQVSPQQLTTLDYGMGWAMWARAAHDVGCRSYGTELSDERNQYAAAHGIQVVSGDQLPQGIFDFVNTEQVMEHIPDVRETVSQLVAALKPGGILKISVPRADGIAGTVAKLQRGEPLTFDEFMPIQPLEHVNSFTSSALTALAREFGLRLVRPSMLQRYAFLAVPRAIGLGHPRNLVKELIRPFYTYRNPANIYVWMQRQ